MKSDTAATATEQSASSVKTAQRVAIGSQEYNEILEFLYDEAHLLDNMKFAEWGKLLAEDLVYTVPLRTTRKAAENAKTIVRSVQHYDDNFRSIMGRIARLTTASAWAEDPPSRIRRMVSNVRVYRSAEANEFHVDSYLLVTRNRFESEDFDLMSAERHDLLRRDGNRYRIARREVILDQAVLGMQNLAFFL
ncbi:MAG: 3-phenylpropionate/cinnamic acid dioxygenase subunit beta [Gammaproteobacteria bacterium]|nr:3-phenylpropionate/cinnamic acid dioxygenase subunit beta [Gammaproteobacteria bacterium]